jgi:2-keto-3-deoxy-6-phosphogluconate aldolase
MLKILCLDVEKVLARNCSNCLNDDLNAASRRTPASFMQPLALQAEAVAFGEGASAAKGFPCGSVGGSKHVKVLRGPFPKAALIPTSAVNVLNASEYSSSALLQLEVKANGQRFRTARRSPERSRNR